MLARALVPFLLLASPLAAQSKISLSSLSPSLHFGPGCVSPISEITASLGTANLPPFNDIQVPALWSAIAVFRKDGQLESRVLTIAAVRPVLVNGQNDFPISGALSLDISPALDEFPLRIFVNLEFRNGAVQVWAPSKNLPESLRKICSNSPPPPPKPALAPAPAPPVISSSKSGCNFKNIGFFESRKSSEDKVKLSGAWTSGFSTRPFYTIDALVEIPICPTDSFDIDIGGTIKTAERSSIDPDSFTAYVSIKPKTEKNFSWSNDFYYGWNVKGGGEFSRKDNFENVVFTPQAVLGYGSNKTDAQGNTRYSYGIELAPALEFGHNRRTKNLRSGYGTIGRIAPSLTAVLLFPIAKSTRTFSITSTYNPRILLSPEPFTDQRIWIAHQTPFKSMAAGTRHYWLNQLSAQLTPLVTFSLKSEFGSVPPVFNIIDYRMTTGLTLKWKWRK
jgi:hypothetical protein